MENQSKSSNSNFGEERNLSEKFDSMEEQSKSSNSSFEDKSTSSASNIMKMQYGSSNIEKWLNEESSLSIPKHDIPETSMEQVSLNQNIQTNCSDCRTQTICLNCVSKTFQDFLIKAQFHSSNIENSPESDEIWSFSSIQKYDVSEISSEQASLNRAVYFREILQEFFMNVQYRLRFPNIENFSESKEKSPFISIPKHDVPEISLEQLSSNQADCLRKSFEMDIVDGKIENIYTDNEDLYVKDDSSSLETASDKELKSDKELESDKELGSDKESGLNKEKLESNKEFELEKLRSAKESGSDKELESIIELKSAKELESDKELGSDKELISIESLELDKAEIQETLEERLQERNSNFTSIAECYWKENEFNKLHPPSICSNLSRKNLKNRQEYPPFSPVSLDDIDEIDSTSIENMEVTDYTDVEDSTSESKMFLGKLRQVEADFKAQTKDVELYRNYSTLPIILKTDKRSLSESASITEPTKSAEFFCMTSIESRIATLHTLKVESGYASMEISGKEKSADSVTNINDITLHPSTSMSDNRFKIISDKEFMDGTKSISEVENRLSRDEINKSLKTKLSSTKSSSMEPSSTKLSLMEPSEDDQVKNMKTQKSKNSTKNVCVNTSDSYEFEPADNQAETTNNKKFENAMNPASLTNQPSETIPDIVKDIPPKLRTTDETQKTDNQVETKSNKEFENAMNPASLTNQPSETIPDMVKDIPPKLRTIDETQKTDNQVETKSNKEFENAMNPMSLTNHCSKTIPDIVKDIHPKLKTTDETQKTDNQGETTSNKKFENAIDPASLINQPSETIPDMVKDIPPKLRTTDDTQKTDNQAEVTNNKEFENAMNPTSLTNQSTETIPDIVKDIPPKLKTTDETQKTDNQAEITSNKESENAMNPTSLTNQSSETISDIVKDIPPKLRTIDETQKADNQAKITSNKEFEKATSLTNQSSKITSNILKDIFLKLKTTDETQETDNLPEIMGDEEFENAMDFTSSLTNEHDDEPEEYPDKIKKEMKCSPKCCLIILLSFIILILSLFLFMLQYYSRPSDINQNDEYVDTFAIAIVELEEGILDHDATVRVLTEYLERDTPLLKVVALIGDTSVDKTYTVDIIKKRLRKRRNNSSSPSLPSFVVLENLRAEHSTVIIDYVKTYQEAYSNQEFTILAIFKVEQIDDDLMRADIDHVINKVKDIFVEANIIMKIIPFKPLSEDALEKYIINTAENIGQTLSQDQIDYYKRRLIEDDTDSQACCY